MAKKKKRTSAGERIQKRREEQEKNRLKYSLEAFFTACDEDGNHFLEAHEFAVAQTVVAELVGGEAFDDDAAARLFDDVKSFDKSGDSKISMKEFVDHLMNLVDIIPKDTDEIVSQLADKAAKVVANTKREVGSEIRRLFRCVDEDNSGYLDESEIITMGELARDLASGLQQELGSKEAVDEFLSLKAFEGKKTTDGKVDLNEFIEHFLNFVHMLKIPKKDIVAKLREMQDIAKDAPLADKPKNSNGDFLAQLKQEAAARSAKVA